MKDVAVLVQGCWVLKSNLACTDEREIRARNRLLTKFAEARMIKSKDFTDASDLPAAAARALLQQLADARKGLGWEFKLATDTSFMENHPELVREQKALLVDLLVNEAPGKDEGTAQGKSPTRTKPKAGRGGRVAGEGKPQSKQPRKS